MQESIFLKPKLRMFWSLCAFQAGYLNSFGFIACHRFVSHLTGFGTQIGVSIGKGDYLIGLEMLLAPFSFILGSFVNSKFTYCRLDKREKPNFTIVAVILLLVVSFIFIFGMTGHFGIFGEPLVLQRDFFLMSLLCFFCGMQNSFFASMTNGKIRTTHLTGLSTDIGADHARIVDRKISKRKRMLMRKVNNTRMQIFISFSIGAFASMLISIKLEYKALLIPLITSAFIFVAIYLAEKTVLTFEAKPKYFIGKLSLLIHTLNNR